MTIQQFLSVHASKLWRKNKKPTINSNFSAVLKQQTSQNIKISYILLQFKEGKEVATISFLHLTL